MHICLDSKLENIDLEGYYDLLITWWAWFHCDDDSLSCLFASSSKCKCLNLAEFYFPKAEIRNPWCIGLNFGSPQICSPRKWNVPIFADVDNVRILRWNQPWLRWILNPKADDHVKDIKILTKKKAQGRSSCDPEVEHVGVLPQAKEHEEPSGAGRSREGFSQEASWGMWALWHLDFEFWPSELWGKRIFTGLSAPSQFVVICYGNPRKLI